MIGFWKIASLTERKENLALVLIFPEPGIEPEYEHIKA